MDTKFKVIFKNEILEGKEEAHVVESFARQFNLPIEKAMIFFSGKPVVLKNDLSIEQARQLRKRCHQLGMKTYAIKAHVKTSQSSGSNHNSKNTNPLTLCPEGTAVLTEQERNYIPEANIDTAHLRLVEPNSYATKTQNESQLHLIKTDHLTLS